MNVMCVATGVCVYMAISTQKDIDEMLKKYTYLKRNVRIYLYRECHLQKMRVLYMWMT